MQPTTATKVPLAWLTVLKFFSSALLRLPYPFIGDIAGGLKTTEGSVGQMLAVGEFAGLGGSLVGPQLDRGFHRRWAMCGFLSVAVGGIVIGVLRNSAGMVVGFCLISLGVNLSTTAVHTLLGDCTPFSERGRKIGIFETSWAIALLIGGLLAGWLIDTFHWSTPFVVFGLVLVVSTPTLFRQLPQRTVRFTDDVHGATRLRFNRLNASLVVGVSVALTLGGVLTFSTFGTFLKQRHDFTTLTLGGVVTAIGIMELVGSAGTATISDRIGKANSVLIGLAVMAIGSLLFSTSGMTSRPAAVVSVVVLFLGFEFAYVALLAIVSEVGGEKRGLVVSVNHATVTITRAGGAALGPWLAGVGSQHVRLVQLIVLALVATSAVLVTPMRTR